jgi:hypothetical protein
VLIPTLIQTVKENPAIVLLGSSGSIIALVVALFSLDARYAHAADVEKVQNQTQKQIIDSSNTLRKQMLEDKIFELDLKKDQAKNQQLSPVDQAMRNRYQQQLNELVRSQIKITQ